MRPTYRAHGGVQAYWHGRWQAVPADKGMLNLNRYPGLYAQEILSRVNGAVLEAGCGAGRVLRHFHNPENKIIGIDFIPDILHKIREADPTLRLASGDVTKLPFPDGCFEGVLAFGLYHNLETGLAEALRETRRVMRAQGLLCASFRADNLQNRALDKISEYESAGKGRSDRRGPVKYFHKMNYKKRELEEVFPSTGFKIESLHFVENMPFLYKFSAFRARAHKAFDERKARAEGYQLSFFGKVLQSFLTSINPAAFCNVYVVIAQKHQL